MPVTWIEGRGYLGNSYIVGDILVDAGVLPSDIAPFRDAITTVVLTHCHFDHTAHLKEIARLCEATILIHPADAPGLTEELLSLSHHFGGSPPETAPGSFINEGDRIGPLLVLHTPGHTPGSICLYLEEEKSLISGDTVFTDGAFGRYDFPGGDRAALQQSIERLARLPVEGLYPGHGLPALQDGHRHIAAARELLVRGYG